MVSEQRLQDASGAFFDAFSANLSPASMLDYFSTTTPVVLQHAPAACPHPQTSRLVGANAVRSYFDLLSTHWIRSDVSLLSPTQVDQQTRRVVITASATWMWRKSGRKWIEDFVWTLDFDEGLEIVSFVIQTVSAPSTCIMQAVDAEPTVVRSKLRRRLLQTTVSTGPLPENISNDSNFY